MTHIVMQAAEFETLDAARRAEVELQRLFETYVEFENTDANPWDATRVAPPLAEFARRHGFEWPLREEARFVLKGAFEEAASLLRVDRMVFFYGGGFDLGGKAMREAFARMGATHTRDRCHLVARVAAPGARADELASFLVEEDYEGQFGVSDDETRVESAWYSVRLENDEQHRFLVFDDSGVQDWAFVTLLPQLSGTDPSFRKRTHTGV